MTEHNHHRGTKNRKLRLFDSADKRSVDDNFREQSGKSQRVVTLHNTGGYLNDHGIVYRGGTGFGYFSSLADRRIGASVSYDHSKGRRGEAKDVRGAKKYVNSRRRFHENAATKKLASEVPEGTSDDLG